MDDTDTLDKKLALGQVKAYPDSYYLQHNPFDGDTDTIIRVRKVKLVRTRKEHFCYGSYILGMDAVEHSTRIGDQALRETAIVDNKWGSNYCCLKCIEQYLQLNGILPSGKNRKRGRR